MTYFKYFFLMTLVLLFLAGCRTLGTGVTVQSPPAGPPPEKTYHKPGPPPHAPAHGYRYKHRDGHELRYDSQIGAYVVVNIPDTYFGNNLYIRLSSDGRWMVSATLNSGWRLAAGSEVPPKLRFYKEKNKMNHKQKNKKIKHKKGYENNQS